MQLTASKDFTDKQGVAHKQGERFSVDNDSEAQDYIRQGNAQQDSSQQQGGQGGQRK